MVMYDVDSNAILAEPLKNKSEREQLNTTKKLHAYLTDRGLQPKLHIMDNECPAAVKRYLQTNDIGLQLVPPHVHRTNLREKAIGTFKDHFIAGLCSVDPNFPMHLWCRLLPLATTTLNLLRPARLNPKLSAEAFLNSAFDYNRTPLAPPGTKILIHETPSQRKTWSPQAVDGWYLGAAPVHYRCHRTYVPTTRSERIARTVEFFPPKLRHAPNVLCGRRHRRGPRSRSRVTTPCSCLPPRPPRRQPICRPQTISRNFSPCPPLPD
jgi:hypothetical protein